MKIKNYFRTLYNDLRVCRLDPYIVYQRRKARKNKIFETIRITIEMALCRTAFIQNPNTELFDKYKKLQWELFHIKAIPLPSKNSGGQK